MFPFLFVKPTPYGSGGGDAFAFSVPTGATAGMAFTFTVTAQKPGGTTTDTGYTGTVTFTSSDVGAFLPTPSTLTSGVGVFSATLSTAGGQTIAGTAATASGTSGSITVSAPNFGSSVSLTNPCPHACFGPMLLLTDGRVFAHVLGTGSNFKSWQILTPDSTGSYQNGTWSAAADMIVARDDFGSCVLPDGRVMVMGGESTPGTPNGSVTGEIYDPAANTWTATASFPVFTFADGTLMVLSANTVLCLGQSENSYIYTISNNSFDAGATMLNGPASPVEETFLRIGGGKIITIDTSVYSATSTTSQYFNGTAWVNLAAVPVGMSSSAAFIEVGPAFLLPNGKAFFIGGNGNTAVLDPAGPTWTAGPLIPPAVFSGDTPGCIMQDGNILTINGPRDPTDDNPVNPPTAWVINPVGGTWTNVTASLPSLNPSLSPTAMGMLALPNGQVAISQSSPTILLWTPASGPTNSWRPVISSITVDASGNYTVTGTQLTGISAGASFGDDLQSDTNYPIVQLTNGATVAYAKTTNWPIAVQAGATVQTCTFVLPAGFSSTGATALVAASGIISNTPVSIPNVPTHFVLVVPTNATAGVGFTFTATIEDSSNTVVTGYNGTVAFASSATGATLPGNITLTNGTGSFSATLTHSGNTFITASDSIATSVSGASSPVSVAVGPLTHFAVLSPVAATAGTKSLLLIAARDAFNNTYTPYSGTVHMTSGDPAAVLPANFTLVSGQSSGKSVTLETSGNILITATDVTTSSITGSTTCVVAPAPPTHFLLVAAGTVTHGVSSFVTFTALDQFNNQATAYNGQFAFTSSDTGASLPGAQGPGVSSGSFAFTLNTTGTQHITATDTLAATLTGATGSITVA